MLGITVLLKNVQAIDRLQDICDVISLHVPLDDSTHYLVDSEFVKKCKDGVIIINSARGKVVDTEALISGLSSGKIGGACLDVLKTKNLLLLLIMNRLCIKNCMILIKLF